MTLNIYKDRFKFSCSHFTIFSQNSAERLHGHNYQIRCSLSLHPIQNDLGMAFDFNAVKPSLQELCDELDEYVLIPKDSRYLQIGVSDRQVDVCFGKKRYSFPASDVRLLPLVNITSEQLAEWFANRLSQKLENLDGWSALRITLEETRGQSVSHTFRR
jgi:6-pyruvoyltetrahydropterin/6-carboxytetrahydropterin synthase